MHLTSCFLEEQHMDVNSIMSHRVLGGTRCQIAATRPMMEARELIHTAGHAKCKLRNVLNRIIGPLMSSSGFSPRFSGRCCQAWQGRQRPRCA